MSPDCLLASERLLSEPWRLLTPFCRTGSLKLCDEDEEDAVTLLPDSVEEDRNGAAAARRASEGSTASCSTERIAGSDSSTTSTEGYSLQLVTVQEGKASLPVSPSICERCLSAINYRILQIRRAELSAICFLH